MELFTSSPESFFYAVEGYYDKEDKHSELIRLQTFYLLNAAGAKLRRPEQLWKLRTDPKQLSPVVNMNADEYREWYSGIKKKYKLR